MFQVPNPLFLQQQGGTMYPQRQMVQRSGFAAGPAAQNPLAAQKDQNAAQQNPLMDKDRFVRLIKSVLPQSFDQQTQDQSMAANRWGVGGELGNMLNSLQGAAQQSPQQVGRITSLGGGLNGLDGSAMASQPFFPDWMRGLFQ